MQSRLNLTARQVALKVLGNFNVNAHDASELLNRHLSSTNEKPKTCELVYGTIRNLSLLDYVLTKTAVFEPTRVNKRLLNTIRIGAYELLFSKSTPDYAIVDQAVNAIESKKARGFVNAILRNMARSIAQRSFECEPLFDSKTLPTSPNSCVVFSRDIFPDPQTSLSKYLSIVFSIPKWLIEQWLSEFSSKQTIDICFGSNRRPSIYLRSNTVKITANELRERLELNKIKCELIESGPMLKLSSNVSIEQLEEFRQGLFTVQDITAAKVAPILDPSPSDVIGDICAAPGTKTTHIAELMGNSGKVIATDIDASRLEKVASSAKRLGLSIIEVADFNSAFDYLNQSHARSVLLDVPCSNTGVMAKRCELRHRITASAIEALADIQFNLLNRVANELSSCRKICYSTCSIMSDENSQVIKRFLDCHRDFSITRSELTLPSAISYGRDGGYVAILTRN